MEPANGQVIRLAPGAAKVVATVRSGRLALDGTTVRPLDSPVLRDRHRPGRGERLGGRDRGAGPKGKLMATPSISARGLLDVAVEDQMLSGRGRVKAATMLGMILFGAITRWARFSRSRKPVRWAAAASVSPGGFGDLAWMNFDRKSTSRSPVLVDPGQQLVAHFLSQDLFGRHTRQ